MLNVERLRCGVAVTGLAVSGLDSGQPNLPGLPGLGQQVALG